MLGKWSNQCVSSARIRELVTNGTLTPFDYIKAKKVAEGEKSKWEKPKMILRHDGFKEKVEKDWAKLQNVRTMLNQLWKAQRDSLLAKITKTEPEPSFKSFRSKENKKNLKNKLQKGCVRFWNDDVDVLKENSYSPKKRLQNAIKTGVKAECLNNSTKYKYILDDLNGGDDLDQAAYETKRKEVEDWLFKLDLHNKWGVYIFYDNEKPLYVGETGLRKSSEKWINGTYHKRFFELSDEHFPLTKPSIKDKEWSLKCTKIRILLLNTHGAKDDSIEKIKSQEMERLLILKYGLEELLNEKPGTKKGPIDDVLSELESEIDGLCDDGELLDIEAKFKQEKEKLQQEIERLNQKLEQQIPDRIPNHQTE
tara:strand:+ start:2172 stop:3269 length:1098 start_codon:yes stop_codon:yes gene_type:complete